MQAMNGTPRAEQGPAARAVRTLRKVRTTAPIVVPLDEPPALTESRTATAGHAPGFSITYSELLALHLCARGWPDAQIAGVLGVPAAAVTALVDSVDERLAVAYDAHRSAPAGRLS